MNHVTYSPSNMAAVMACPAAVPLPGVVFLHVVRLPNRKLQAVAGITYPAGAVTCIARAMHELDGNGALVGDRWVMYADSVERQKNYAGRAPGFVMYTGVGG